MKIWPNKQKKINQKQTTYDLDVELNKNFETVNRILIEFREKDGQNRRPDVKFQHSRKKNFLKNQMEIIYLKYNIRNKKFIKVT